MKNSIKCMLILAGLLFISSAAMAQVKKVQQSKVQQSQVQKKQVDQGEIKKQIEKGILNQKAILKNYPKIIATAGGSIIIVHPTKPQDEKTKRQNFLNRWAQYNLGGNSSNPIGKYYPVWQSDEISFPSGYRMPTFDEMNKLINEYTIYIQPDLNKNPGSKDGIWIGVDEETCKKANKNNFNGCLFIPVTSFYVEPYGWSSTGEDNGYYMTSTSYSYSETLMKAISIYVGKTPREFNYYEYAVSTEEPTPLKYYFFVRPIKK